MSQTNNLTSKDPLGHLKLSVSNLKNSHKFYSKLFKKLGYRKVADNGWATKQGFGIWLGQAKHQEPKYKFSAPGIHHFCFKAESKQQVDELYNLLLKKQIQIYDPPAHYPEYTKDYYAVFFADPDGIKLELAYY